MVEFNIDVYYDGSDNISKYLESVDGVTTNIGFLKKSKIVNYENFIRETLSLNKDKKPISFQVFGNTKKECKEQAIKIISIAQDCNSPVYVKIPIIGPNGDSFVSLVKELVFTNNYSINTTCVYTKDQIDELEFLNDTTIPTIVSLFCGRIGDTGHDPMDIVNYAVSKFRNNDNVKILWAGCQRVYDILAADRSHCDIITVPEGVLKKINRLGTELHSFSIKTSYDFFVDGEELVL